MLPTHNNTVQPANRSAKRRLDTQGVNNTNEHNTEDPNSNKRIKLDHQALNQAPPPLNRVQANSSTPSLATLPSFSNIIDLLSPKDIDSLAKAGKEVNASLKNILHERVEGLKNQISFQKENDVYALKIFDLTKSQRLKNLYKASKKMGNKTDLANCFNYLKKAPKMLFIDQLWNQNKEQLTSTVRSFERSCRNQLNTLREHSITSHQFTDNTSILAQALLYCITSIENAEPCFQAIYRALENKINQWSNINHDLLSIDINRLIYRTATELGARPDVLDPNDDIRNINTPLLIWAAVDIVDFELVEMLVDEGADIDCTDVLEQEFNMIWYLSRTPGMDNTDSVNTIKKLARLGADIHTGDDAEEGNDTGGRRDTCIVQAIAAGNVEIARTLFELGANSNDVSINNESLFEIAKNLSNPGTKTRMLLLLDEKGVIKPGEQQEFYEHLFEDLEDLFA